MLQADAWYRQLLRSHEMMQQLVGGADPSSPLDADWDADTASVTSTDYTDKAEESAGTLACDMTPVLRLMTQLCLHCRLDSQLQLICAAELLCLLA